MRSLKRSSQCPPSGKVRESGALSTSCQKLHNMPPIDGNSKAFPLINQTEGFLVIPGYSSVVTGPGEDNIGMENLNQLQQDLEKLLSTSALRNRRLRLEIATIDRNEQKREHKKGKLHNKQASLKRKRPEEKIKFKDVKNTSRLIKMKYYSAAASNFGSNTTSKPEVPKVSFPKNDTSDKFWQSIEPYCTEVTKDDVAFLDELIQECNQEVDVKIPEIGNHYSSEWSDEMLLHEQAQGHIGHFGKSKTLSINNDFKRNGLNTTVETFASPLTQRLFAALIKESDVSSPEEKFKFPNVVVAKSSNGHKTGMCLDKRLRKELVEQGILDVEDLTKNMSPDDEILQEIKKTQEELSTVNSNNAKELTNLRTLVIKDLLRQEVKEALDKVDDKVMEMYNKIMAAKQKQCTKGDNEEFDTPLFQKPDLTEFVEEANGIMRQQILLHNEITALTDFTKF